MRKVGMGAKKDNKEMVPFDEHMRSVNEIGRLQELAAGLQAEIEELKGTGNKAPEEKK